MRIVFFILLLVPCYALETIICERISGSYDCHVFSESEPEYLEDVIHVYESDGMNTSVKDDDEDDTEISKKEEYPPLIFPFYQVRW